MNSKILLIVILQLAAYRTVTSQCLNRILPGCAQNMLPMAESLLPNPLLMNPLANQVLLNQPTYMPTETIIPNSIMPTTTIIQDSTVANNLANALQLLVVSNLLANTLPCAGADVVVPSMPGYGPYDMIGANMMPLAISSVGGLGFNYIY